ncbi:hypothetical protein DFH11DRAFT_1608368 [Phellopilus nigrolimitatus]|nr:hypothetical protein DFH11DRAFT_1608368 [Phellopilus nigrolimitatus]
MTSLKICVRLCLFSAILPRLSARASFPYPDGICFLSLTADPTSTAKPAVSSTPNVPLSTSVRAPLLSLAHFIPTTSSSARVPARPAPSHRAAHPAAFGYYSNTDDASVHLVATAAPLPGIIVHRSRAPHAVFPRRTECPSSAMPSAPNALRARRALRRKQNGSNYSPQINSHRNMSRGAGAEMDGECRFQRV